MDTNHRLIERLIGSPVIPGPYSREYLSHLLSESYATRREEAAVEALRALLADCDRFIDVGANVGQYTHNASLAMKAGEIVSIEANPFLIPTLEELGRYIEADSSIRVTVVNAAVTDQEGPMPFFVSTAHATLGSVVPESVSGETLAVTVPGRRLDNFYKRSLKTLIKIDVEGAEYRVLFSAKRFIESDHTVFFIEMHGWGDPTIGKYPIHVCGLLRRNGYAMRHIGLGNHYLFCRAGAMQCLLRYLQAAPRLGLMALAYRYARPAVPMLRRIRAFCSKLLRRG